jgi:hypothetical protein
MTLFPLIVSCCAAWGPHVHQVIARSFAMEFFPNITDRQRRFLMLGSIYADGLDKTITHSMQHVTTILREIEDESSDLYWFFWGIFTHILPDTFAHAGKSRSFITAVGLRHHISELVMDSVVAHRAETSFMWLPASIKKDLIGMGIRFSGVFRIFYPVIWFVSKFLPIHHGLERIEHDKCPKLGYPVAVRNFERHLGAMLQSLREARLRLHDREFNDARVRELCTRLVFEIVCWTGPPSDRPIAIVWGES